MSPSDIIAAYGAILATLLGIVQISHWRHSRKFLAVEVLQFHYPDDVEIEVSISNRGQFAVTLTFVAFGRTGVHWRSFWRRIALDIASMSSIVEWQEAGTIKGPRIDGHVLQPGETLKAVATKASFMRFGAPPHLKSFWRVKPSVWIEHSQGDRPICKVIKWDV